MNYKIIVCLILSLSYFLNGVLCQVSDLDRAEHFCGTSYAEMPAQDKAAYIRAMESSDHSILADSIILPVVIHNLTWHQRGYVADEKLVTWINNTNDLLANRGAYFDSTGVDTRLRLCLAKEDPAGHPTSGIVHQEHVISLHEDLYRFNGHLYPTWDLSRYINVYVIESRAGVTSFPWGRDFEGMQVNSRSIEVKKGEAVLAHELGHYLGLYHTFTGGCRNDGCLEKGDMVCDTRPDAISYTRCVQLNSCFTDVYLPDENNPFTEDGLDMDDNVMDGGLCQRNFTAGQVERMHWALETYKMPDVSLLAQKNICASCAFTPADFVLPDIETTMGESLFLEVEESNPDVQYSWQLNGQEIGVGSSLDYIPEETGVDRLRLSWINTSDAECVSEWTMEKSVATVCDTLSKGIQMPQAYYVDSCYALNITGMPDLSWRFLDQTGEGQNINLCTPQKGIHPLMFTYGQGSCMSSDSILLYVEDIADRQVRKYFQQEIVQDLPADTGTGVVSMEAVNESTKLMLGERWAGNDILFNRSIDTSENFIAYWNYKAQYIENLELIHRDTFSQELESDFPILPNMQIHFKNMYRDERDGSVYFVAVESYAVSSLMRGYIIGKVDFLGQVVWAKRIISPQVWDSANEDVKPGYVFPSDKGLIFAVDELICMVSPEGVLQSSQRIEREPQAQYPDGLGGSVNQFYYHNKKLYLYSIHIQVDSSTFEEGISRDLDFIRYLSIAQIDLDSKQIKTISSPFELSQTSTLKMKSHMDGMLLYWFNENDRGLINDASPKDIGQNMIKFNQDLEIEWFRSYSDLTTIRRSFLENNMHIMKNGDFIVSMGEPRFGPFDVVEDSGYTIFLRYNKNGELLEHRKYSAEGPGGRGGDSVLNRNEPNTLGSDGLFVVNMRKQDTIGRAFLKHFPLEEGLLDCPQLESDYVEVDTSFVFSDTIHTLLLLEEEVRLEPIALEVEKTHYETISLCENAHDLTDYSFSSIDTLCGGNEVAGYRIEMCRANGTAADSVQLSYYLSSPLSEETYPVYTERVAFSKDALCAVHEVSLPISDYYVMLNAAPAYPGPYTLKKDFFDARVQMEYDYTNNMEFIGACSFSVSTEPNPAETKTSLSIVPNPASHSISISVNQKRITQYALYAITGQLLTNGLVEGRTQRIDVSDLATGLYLLKATLSDGEELTERVVIQAR